MKTFRKMLAITLVTMMAVLLMPTFGSLKVSAMEKEPDVVCKIIETGKTYATVQEAVVAVAKDQTIQMIADVDLKATIEIENSTFILDLNGHVLNAANIAEPTNSGNAACVIYNSGGTLTIIDSDSEAAHTNWNDTHPTSEGNADLSGVKGGVLTGGKGRNFNGYIDGGAIYNTKNLTLSGGTIIGNKASSGAGVFSVGIASFTMTGGIITKNTATSEGGGVKIEGYATFTMTGGEITDNTGHGVHYSSTGKLTIGGTAKISGNVYKSEANNLYMASVKKIRISTDKPLEKGASVGVYQNTPGVLTDTTAKETDASYFHSDKDGYVVVYDSTNQVLKLAKDINDCTIASIDDQTYTGSAIEPDITVTDGTTPLAKDTDYTIAFENNTNAGTATVKITGIGKYTGNKSATFTITKKQLTVKDGYGPAADGKTYDGTTTATVTSVGTIEGIAAEDTDKVTVTATGTFNDKNVGNGKTITVVYSLTGEKASNYIKPADNSAVADIDKKAITVTPDADQSTEYMYADPVLTYTYSGNADGETPVFEGALTRAAGDDVTAEGYAIGLGTLALKDNGTFKASNYELELDKTTVYFFVTKAKIDLPVAAENLIYTGNEQYGISTIFGAPYSVTGTKSATDAGKYTVTAELTDKDNFEWNIETPTSEDQQIEWEIAKRSITLTSGSASKIADDEPLTCEEVTVSGDGFVAGEGFDYTVTGSQTKAGESKNTFTYTAKSGTNADNYDVTKVEGTLTVDKLPEIIGGAGQTIDLGKAEGAEFVSDASFDKFVKVTVDDKDVDVKYYTAVSGSTKITFTKEYLQTLSAGKHTIGVVSTTGTAEAEFTVKAAEKAPDTGDSSNVLLYSAVALFSLAGAVLLRKKKFSV